MPERYKFRKDDKIGNLAAEEDQEFLDNCFYDNGDLSVIKDKKNLRSIIVGRTGTGKSAILMKVAKDVGNDAIVLNPDSLAFAYVANSNIVRYYEALGINLDPFFKLLWRHILTVETLKKFLEAHPSAKTSGFIDSIKRILKSGGHKKEKQAIDYLENWGKNFWNETEYRVKEITETLEREIKSSIDVKSLKSGISAEALGKLTNEERTDIRNLGQKVVSNTQIEALDNVINMLNKVLTNKQKVYYILIDKLDENWVDEDIRYKLLMALIVTVKDFSKVENVKIIISMRKDLLDRIFRVCRPSGFQEEKYKDFSYLIRWDNQKLVGLLDLRINFLIKHKYEKNKVVTHNDILPNKIKRTEITEYLFKRMTRPRDVISFFNICIEQSFKNSRITASVIKEAEGEYSRSKLRAVADEWHNDFDKLLEIANILKNQRANFKISSIGDEIVAEICLNIAVETDTNKINGDLSRKIMDVTNEKLSITNFKNYCFRIFYIVGIVGLKLETFESYAWCDEKGRSISQSEINPNTGVCIHPAFHRALGIKS